MFRSMRYCMRNKGDDGEGVPSQNADAFHEKRAAQKRRELRVVFATGLVAMIVGFIVVGMGFAIQHIPWGLLVGATWLSGAGILTMSTADLDLDDFLSSSPMSFKSFCLALLFLGMSDAPAIRHPWIVLLRALPAIYGLLCLKWVQPTARPTSVVNAWCLMDVLGSGTAAVLLGSERRLIEGIGKIVGGVVIGMVWASARHVWRMDHTATFWAVGYLKLFSDGVAGMSVSISVSVESGNLSTGILGFAFMVLAPPLVFAFRHRLFALLARRFDRKTEKLYKIKRAYESHFPGNILDSSDCECVVSWPGE
jgi:hypothetical protein